MVGRIRRSALGLITTVFVFLVIVSGAYCQADPNEPNGELGDATAIDIGGTFGGSTSPAGDVDFYKFEIYSPGILEVRLKAVPDDMRTRIDFYGKNFNWITRIDTSNPGDLVTLKLDITNPGLYYLGILDLAGKSHDLGYSFDLNFEPVVDGNEPNGEIGDATEIDFGQAANGYIFTKGDVDFYKFYVNSTGILDVVLEGVPDDMRSRIDFYGKNFNWITRVDASNPGDLVTLSLDLSSPGWYYVGILDLAGQSHNVPYSFRPEFEQVLDEDEPDGEIGDATEIGFGDLVSGHIFPRADGDFYRFNVPSPGILEVKLTDSPDDMKTRIDFYGKNYNWITRKDASNPGDLVTLSLDLSSPGWYHVGIVDLEGKSHNVQYAFTPTFEPVVDGNEPNNEIGDAAETSFGEVASGLIFPKGDADFYKLWAASGKLEVELTDSPDDMKARIDLYGKNFNWITRTDASNPGDLATLEYEVVNPGWYYIGITDLAGKSHNLGYSFTARGVGATKSDLGTTKDGALETKTGTGNAQGAPVGAAGGTTTSYREATLTHSGFDFSEGTTGEYPTHDGEIISWQSDLMATTHPDYPRDSDYLWWRNLHLDDVNHASQTKDMGAVDISTVRTVPADWDKSPLIPPLLVGHTIVAKCYDGYVKFQVISVDPVDWSARVRYSYSADATFDDAAS
jgi:hypothetical protein